MPHRRDALLAFLDVPGDVSVCKKRVDALLSDDDDAGAGRGVGVGHALTPLGSARTTVPVIGDRVIKLYRPGNRRPFVGRSPQRQFRSLTDQQQLLGHRG